MLCLLWIKCFNFLNYVLIANENDFVHVSMLFLKELWMKNSLITRLERVYKCLELYLNCSWIVLVWLVLYLNKWWLRVLATFAKQAFLKVSEMNVYRKFSYKRALMKCTSKRIDFQKNFSIMFFKRDFLKIVLNKFS